MADARRTNEFLMQVRDLAARGEVLVSRHGLQELSADGILLDDIIAGLSAAIVVEEYPAYTKGPCVLVLQRDGANQPISCIVGHCKRTFGAGGAGHGLSARSEPLVADFMKRTR